MRAIKPVLAGNVSRPTMETPEIAERFNRVLGETVEAMEEARVRYAFIGGIASGGLGRPRSTHDIDLIVMPDDAETALRSLAKRGFKVERTDPSWLYKGFKENILVDIIFKSKGEIYLDNEMYQRLVKAEFHGKELKLVAPEDLLIIKAVAHGELTPSHWHDAIGLLSHATIDWEYLLRRARRAPRRVLSLLLYAQSNDVWVPNQVVHELYQVVFGQSRQPQAAPRAGANPLGDARRAGSSTPAESPGASGSASGSMSVCYAAAHLREALAEDVRSSELDIDIERAGDRILLRGEVTQPERREMVERIAREKCPGCTIDNQIRIIWVDPTAGVEDVK
jgi:predicted nucleotidyltransferase